jgi:hypothetical protein
MAVDEWLQPSTPISGRLKRVSLAWAIVSALQAYPAAAQTCAGSPSLDPGTVQVQGNVGVTSGTPTFGAEALAGFRRGIFSAVRFTAATEDNFSKVLVNTWGANLRANRVAVCPFVEIGMTFLKTPTLRGQGASLEAGVQVGVIVAEIGSIRMIPSFGITRYDRNTQYTGPVNVTTSSAAFNRGRVGIGVEFNRRIGIVPQWLFPFESEDAGVVFVLSSALKIGG